MQSKNDHKVPSNLFNKTNTINVLLTLTFKKFGMCIICHKKRFLCELYKIANLLSNCMLYKVKFGILENRIIIE